MVKIAYVLPEKNQKKWKKFVENAAFERFVNYFWNHAEDEIKLRELKKVFPDLNVDKYIEEGINLGVIERADRRYHLHLELQNEPPEIPSVDVKSLFKDFTKNQISGVLFRFLVKYNFELLDIPLFFDADSTLYQKFLATPIATSCSEKDSQIHFQAIDNLAHSGITLANYFYHVDNREKLSAEEQKLYELVGDVNPDYVLHAFGIRLLKFLTKDEIKPLRKDIFMTALTELGFVREVEANTFVLDRPIFETKDELELPEIQIDDLLTRQFYLAELVKQLQGQFDKQFLEVEM
jgi:hypothetical protein